MEATKKTQGKWQIMCLVLLLAGMIFGISRDAAALERIFTENEQSVYVGDQFDLMNLVEPDMKAGTTFHLTETSTETASVTETGILTCLKEGTVTVEAERKNDDDTSYKDTIEINVIAPEQVKLAYGQSVSKPMQEYLLQMGYTLSADRNSVTISEDGSLQAVGFRPSVIYADNGRGSCCAIAEVTIETPSYSQEYVTRAVGSKATAVGVDGFSFIGSGSEKITYATEDNKVAVWTTQGIQAVAKGQTTLKATLTAYNKDTITLTMPVYVTTPTVSGKTVILASGCVKKPSISGTIAQSKITWDPEKQGAAYFTEQGDIFANYKGSKKLTLNIDGLDFSILVRVSNPTYADFNIIMYKGMGKTLKLKGLVPGSKVSFSSNNKKKVTITSRGKMKAKKISHTNITVKADGRTFKIWVEISSKRGYRASKKAIAISKTKTTYSQARRMSKSFYDCSSLVSRVYRKYDVYFGSKSGWSPVAADIGKWCTRNHKVIAKKAVSYKKLLPGDLIFFSGWRNGRYKNITHIEIYTGGAKDVSASSRYGKVVHYGYGKGDSVVLVARPTK